MLMMSDCSTAFIRKFLLVTVLLAGLFLLLSCGRDDQLWSLQVKDPRSGTVYYEVGTKPGTVFTLSYIHSVSGSPVRGLFKLTAKGKPEPMTTVYSSFGPGLPLDYNNYIIEDGLITVYHDEDPRENIRLWVSPQTEEMITSA